MQYYLFRTCLSWNMNSSNINDNRLLCKGSHCIRGQGETESFFVLCQWSLEPGLIRGAKAYTGSKSAPARLAEFISNLLTLLRAQIETISRAHTPEVLSVRSDSMIYRRGVLGSAKQRLKFKDWFCNRGESTGLWIARRQYKFVLCIVYEVQCFVHILKKKKRQLALWPTI